MVDSPNQTGDRIGVEITSTALNAVVIDKNDAIVAARVAEIGDTESSVPELVTLVESLKNEYGAFGGVGIAVPGLFDKKNGRGPSSANLPKHSDVGLVNEVEA